MEGTLEFAPWQIPWAPQLGGRCTVDLAEQDPEAASSWEEMLAHFYLPTRGEVVLPFDGADPTNATHHARSVEEEEEEEEILIERHENDCKGRKYEND